VVGALASTTANSHRVAATIAAYFAFIDSESAAFRLVFESDLRSDPDVRDIVDRVAAGCAAAIAAVIRRTPAFRRRSPNSWAWQWPEWPT